MSDLPLFEIPANHDARWARLGARDLDRARRALGAQARAVHHVGATSLPGAPESAVLDLLAEVESLAQLAQARLRLLAHGFEPADEAREDCRLYIVDDLITGERRVELRCYPAQHPETEHAPALFALLRARPHLASAYREHKAAVRALHAADEAAYAAAKRAWLERVLDEALALWRVR
jgi:GrpB-like predicted nucleotidyltransferase (UPF0157 family)